MPLPSHVTKLTKELPYALRINLEGYLTSVDTARPEIYQETQVSLDNVSRDEFLFTAAVWWIWNLIDSQRWVVGHSLELARQFGASQIQAGSVSLAGGSDDVEGLKKLSADLRRWLIRKKMEFVFEADDLSDLLIGIQSRESDAD